MIEFILSLHWGWWLAVGAAVFVVIVWKLPESDGGGYGGSV